MDVPLALYNIEVRYGFKEYKSKSSTYSQQTDVVGLSALKIYLLSFGYLIQTCRINNKKHMKKMAQSEKPVAFMRIVSLA